MLLSFLSWDCCWSGSGDKIAAILQQKRAARPNGVATCRPSCQAHTAAWLLCWVCTWPDGLADGLLKALSSLAITGLPAVCQAANFILAPSLLACRRHQARCEQLSCGRQMLQLRCSASRTLWQPRSQSCAEFSRCSLPSSPLISDPEPAVLVQLTGVMVSHS